MQQEDFNKKKKAGGVEDIPQDVPPPELLALLAQRSDEQKNPQIADYLALLEGLRKVKPFRTVVPTNVPRSFLDAIEFYDSGGTRRVYFYINKVWRYVALT